MVWHENIVIEEVFSMKIYIKNGDGKMYEAFQVDKNTYAFTTGNKTFELSLSESNEMQDLSILSEQEKKKMTKEIFSNNEILEQLRDAKKIEIVIFHIIVGMKWNLIY